MREDEERIIIKFIDQYYNTAIGLSVLNMYENGQPFDVILEYIEDYIK